VVVSGAVVPVKRSAIVLSVVWCVLNNFRFVCLRRRSVKLRHQHRFRLRLRHRSRRRSRRRSCSPTVQRRHAPTRRRHRRRHCRPRRQPRPTATSSRNVINVSAASSIRNVFALGVVIRVKRKVCRAVVRRRSQTVATSLSVPRCQRRSRRRSVKHPLRPVNRRLSVKHHNRRQ